MKLEELAVRDGSLAGYISLGAVEHDRTGPDAILAEARRLPDTAECRYRGPTCATMLSSVATGTGPRLSGANFSTATASSTETAKMR